MTCPYCGRTIDPWETIVDSEEGLAHKSCGAAVAVALPAVSITEQMVAAVDELLAVPRLDGQTDADWRQRRAKGVVQVFAANGWVIG